VVVKYGAERCLGEPPLRAKVCQDNGYATVYFTHEPDPIVALLEITLVDAYGIHPDEVAFDSKFELANIC